MQGEENTLFLHKKTGDIINITEEDFLLSERDEPLSDLPEWQQEQVKIARALDETDDYIELPNRSKINDYEIMEKFCLSITDDTMREKLYYAIKGTGAFRRFKQKIQEFGVVDDWHEFREQAYREIAIAWCNDHQIPFTESE